MVQFLKAKPTSFVNQPVGVVGVDMGGQRAGQVLASTANNLAQQFFKEATDNEKKLGEDAALELPIRDTQGNLEFRTIDKSLSQVAQEAADPVVRRRYTEALGVDLYKRINEIRLDSTSSEDFNSKTQAFMGSYIDEVNKLGGAEYQNVITQSVTNLSTQHFYAMATEERKEQLRVASLNALAINQKSTADMASSALQDIKLNPNNILEIINTYEANVNLLAIQNDENLKTNIKYIDKTLSGIEMYTWDWNEKAKELGIDKQPKAGVIAQKILLTHPDAVSVADNGYLMVDYSKIN